MRRSRIGGSAAAAVAAVAMAAEGEETSVMDLSPSSHKLFGVARRAVCVRRDPVRREA